VPAKQRTSKMNSSGILDAGFRRGQGDENVSDTAAFQLAQLFWRQTTRLAGGADGEGRTCQPDSSPSSQDAFAEITFRPIR
jgi:hypothetical protein